MKIARDSLYSLATSKDKYLRQKAYIVFAVACLNRLNQTAGQTF
jgi:hypothetical protein